MVRDGQGDYGFDIWEMDGLKRTTWNVHDFAVTNIYTNGGDYSAFNHLGKPTVFALVQLKML